MRISHLLTLKELGLFSAQQFKQSFIQQKIEYEETISASPGIVSTCVFNQKTVDFLFELDRSILLHIYLNLEKIFSELEAVKFCSCLKQNSYLKIALTAHIINEYKSFKAPVMIGLLNDYDLFSNIPIQFIHDFYLSNKEYAQEVAQHPAIIAHLASINRNLHYIWGNYQIDTQPVELVAWPRGCHL